MLLFLLLGCPPTESAKPDEPGDSGLDCIDDDCGGGGYDGDCDDNNPEINPYADELCDGVDNNCNGEIDEGVLTAVYADVDGDGYGDAATAREECEAPSGFVLNAEDCDDADATAYPGAEEVCDGADDDCDGAIDDGVLETSFADADGDGHGDPAALVESCELVENTSPLADDCDDTTASAFPGNEEVCDEIDNDCDGEVDEGVTTTWYVDVDGDGWGEATTAEACAQPTGYAAVTGDCDDTNASVSPDATEACDGVDEDCDGVVDDDGSDTATWYADTDGDGYGDPDTFVDDCAAPAGYVSNADDCDDADVTVNPDTTWFYDYDGDGYGDVGHSYTGCSPPAGFVADDSDCDDGAATAHPGGTETCDGLDDDCDGLTDADDPDSSGVGTWYADADGDGYGDAAVPSEGCEQPVGSVLDATDCDDGDASLSPGELEVCDGADNDCDALVDDDDPAVADTTTWHADADADGYGDPAVLADACVAPAGAIEDDTDCDDAAAAIHLGAGEVCDGVDDDCDALVDEDDPGLVDATEWHVDADGDGYGDPAVDIEACTAPSGDVADGTDCDDSDPTAYPGASEDFDGVDDDCDGTVDDGAYGLDCADILAADPTSADGTYTIDPDGAGGTAPFSVECEMTIDGGGWTQAIQDYLDHLSTGWSRRYLYTEGGAWYESPVTTLVWDWSVYQPLNGDYSYATSGTSAMGSFSCSHVESGSWGVGCSNGGGSTYKVLPIYSSDPSAALSMICQDRPDAFSAGACQADASIWVREE